MHELGDRIYLSAPLVDDSDIRAVVAALKSGWIAPVGPALSAFEEQMAAYLGVSHAVGLSSGTAAIHLGLKYLGVKPGDRVLVPALTFGATAFAVKYLGAEPVFVDVDDSWNMDPEQTRFALETLGREGRQAVAVLPVDMYGSPANYLELEPLLLEFGVPILEDAAEGLGGTHRGKKLGGFGAGAALSFNGNKILTTSGGGMLMTNDSDFAAKTRYWATQSREDSPWYEHKEVGYNYRLSNILAALGGSQLKRISETVTKRREIRERYRTTLNGINGVYVQEDPPWGESNAWLSVVTFDLNLHRDAPTLVRVA
jgi:dTDP-4-amino-4,6-dideoxygalactose transaminase